MSQEQADMHVLGLFLQQCFQLRNLEPWAERKQALTDFLLNVKTLSFLRNNFLCTGKASERTPFALELLTTPSFFACLMESSPVKQAAWLVTMIARTKESANLPCFREDMEGQRLRIQSQVDFTSFCHSAQHLKTVRFLKLNGYQFLLNFFLGVAVLL